MKILISSLPKSDWWGNGMPIYENNWVMAIGNKPRQSIVAEAFQNFSHTLQKFCNVVKVPFPPQFDSDKKYKHDFIFVRDSFI